MNRDHRYCVYTKPLTCTYARKKDLLKETNKHEKRPLIETNMYEKSLQILCIQNTPHMCIHIT